MLELQHKQSYSIGAMKARIYESLLLIVYLFMISFISGTILQNVTKMDDDCKTQLSTMMCSHGIPLALPRNISGVIIEDYLQDRIGNESFSHESWSSIYFLDITVNLRVGFRLHDNSFRPLQRLQQLGIHSPFYKFNNQTRVFEGLVRLQTLNLSSCRYLDAAAVIALLTPLTRLDTLDLGQVGTYGNRFMILDDAFVSMLKRKRIRTISLSGCNLMFRSMLHVNKMSLSLHDIDVSNTSITKQNNVLIDNQVLDTLFPTLKIVDMSFLQTRFLNIDYSFLDNQIYDKGCNDSGGWLKLLLRLEHLKINGLIKNSLRANNSSFDLKKCRVSLRSLQIRANKVSVLNVTIKLPDVLFLAHIDLSSNDIGYLGHSVLDSVSSLETLNLSDNKLHLMESFIEFKYLFAKHKKLKHLNLSKNGLSFLPFKMFTNNIDLNFLDLSHNNLSSISFYIKHLVKLQYLDLSQNKIYYIDNLALNDLKILAAHYSSNLSINIDNNPFVCKCKSLPFIRWLFKNKNIKSHHNRNLTCLFKTEDRVVIDNSVLDKIAYSCIESTIIITSSSTVSVLFVLVSLVISFLIYKKCKEVNLRKRRNFLQEFNLGNIPQKYLCFVSYSSDDDEQEIKQMIANIRESLNELIQTDRDVLCENNGSFKIGFPIVEEIIRCIVESCVGIFYVTNNFCQSQWCQMELRETYELQKPIILVFKERIDERIMSPLLFKIFKQFTRAKLIVREDGQIEMAPDFKQLSDSVLQLASARFDENND